MRKVSSVVRHYMARTSVWREVILVPRLGNLDQNREA